jgi:mono/diheme cytochrome c family protein
MSRFDMAGFPSHLNSGGTNAKQNRSLVIAALAISAALLLLPFIFRLDGKPHADWQQFLGRFHPLILHIPIGLLLLVPLLELAGIKRPALREAAAFVLSLSYLATLGALMLGYLLAYGSGEAGPTVTQHMWGGIALAISILACVFARPLLAQESPFRFAYPVLLTGTLGLLSWTAHQGGSITHGSNYLTQFMPAPLKRLVPGQSSQATNPGSFYAKQIHPIFDANCVSCHGESKVSGGLRLDSYDQLMRGGTDGAAIVAGNAEKSLLFTRITLPATHKLFMPAEGKPPLPPEQIAYIKAWIAQGASPTDAKVAGISIREAEPEAPIIPVGDYSSLEPTIQQMMKSQGAKLMPVSSQPSDGLVLYTVDTASSFDDAQLRLFEKFAPYIVEVELGRTAVTDACFETLAKFPHLRAIHLEGTKITGSGLAKLAPLSQLSYLNLSGTLVTQTAVAPLASMKQLRHLYIHDTPAQPSQESATTQ